MNKKKHPLGKRISYWFDNKMAQGFGAKVRLLLIITIIFVFLVGLLAALTHGGVREHFGEDFIRSFMYSLGKGGALSPDDAGISAGYFFLMLITIIYCMFFSAILIGLISNALRTKVDDLGKGHSHVIENDHTLILGFNDATFVLLTELIESNKNAVNPQTVVILGEVDQKNMIEQIQKKLGWPKRASKTRIVCRTGSIYNFDDLKRCSIETCRSIIINATNDFEAVKAIMACSYILNESAEDDDEPPFLVSIIQSEENLIEAKLAARGKTEQSLIILALNEVLARIMVHTSRQPGLSDVFTELFNFAGSELYIISNDPWYPSFVGKSIADINRTLQDSFAIGLRKPDDSIIIDAPMETLFEAGDSLIVVKEDDDPLKVMSHPIDLIKPSSVPAKPAEEVEVLIIGVEPVLDDVLREYSNYLPSGSSICIVDRDDLFSSVVDENILELLQDKNIKLSLKTLDISHKKQLNKLLLGYSPDCVLVLANEDASDPEAEDERIMRTLIYLREYRNRIGKHFSITYEMLLSKNKELAAATEPDDFIISRQFSALMMSQISQNKEMAPLFETLLSSNGFEIYMKPASWYLPLEKPIDLINISQIVAERGETFFGIRQKKNGHYQIANINPVKCTSNEVLKKYVFSSDDYIVVLAENNLFPKQS